MKSHRIVTVAGTVVFGALLLGAPHAAAAPPPVNPTGVEIAIADPEPHVPPKPGSPEIGTPPSEVAPDPCGTDCPPADCPEGQLCEPPANPCDEPCEPVEEPEQPAEPEPPVATPSAAPTAQPRPVPSTDADTVPTPNRIDTGEGPGDPVNWWLVGIPALVLLGLAAGGAHLWITRTERSPR